MSNKAGGVKPGNTQTKGKTTTSSAKPLPYEARTAARSETEGKATARTKAAAAAAAAPPKPKGASVLANALRTPSKVRSILLTAAVAGITATGVWYGASLKIEEQVNEEKRKLKAAAPDERITHLQDARQKLVGARDELATKIAELQAKQKRNQMTESGR